MDAFSFGLAVAKDPHLFKSGQNRTKSWECVSVQLCDRRENCENIGNEKKKNFAKKRKRKNISELKLIISAK